MKNGKIKLTSLKRKHLIVSKAQLKEIHGGKKNSTICPDWPLC